MTDNYIQIPDLLPVRGTPTRVSSEVSFTPSRLVVCKVCGHFEVYSGTTVTAGNSLSVGDSGDRRCLGGHEPSGPRQASDPAITLQRTDRWGTSWASRL
jgi:hypothetical protein